MVDLSYKGKDILNIGEPNIKEGDTLKICFYVIDNMSNPFLQFLFINDNDTLKLLQFKYQGNVPSKEGYNIIKKIFIDFDEQINYTGCIDNILFYEMIFIIENVNYKTKKDKLWFLLVDEIINKKYYLHMNVDEEVVSFFLKNSSLLFLIDGEKRILPSPIACYYGNYLNYVKAISVFGVQKASLYASKGPFYYFGNYNEALKRSVWNKNFLPYSINNYLIAGKNGKYKAGGIVRFALFLDKIKLIRNANEDVKNKIDYINNYYSLIYYKENDIKYCIREYSNQYPVSYFSVNTNNIDSVDDMYKIKIE
tara:strand:- start:2276 stop:3202 length:927 start_codon:yes stop_codon:yes gene_type:complete